MIETILLTLIMIQIEQPICVEVDPFEVCDLESGVNYWLNDSGTYYRGEKVCNFTINSYCSL